MLPTKQRPQKYWQSIISDIMITRQNGKCAICGSAFTNNLRSECDHNHATGKIRGFLCSSCNKRLSIIESGKSNDWYVMNKEIVDKYLSSETPYEYLPFISSRCADNLKMIKVSEDIHRALVAARSREMKKTGEIISFSEVIGMLLEGER